MPASPHSTVVHNKTSDWASKVQDDGCHEKLHNALLDSCKLLDYAFIAAIIIYISSQERARRNRSEISLLSANNNH